MDPLNSIEVINVSKSFTYNTIDVDNQKRIKKKKINHITNKVIDDISLTIRKGEVVGIIGCNGSGKSTLLSLLARIIEPDSGTIEWSGKVASILELGMGFHQDLSGRDNIYLKGELYGFSKKELDLKIDRIIDYSGIGDYIDNPVRTYSSGMRGRLAFAIMINVDSEIMLIDEVLSVGDIAFSIKAQQHFRKLAKSNKTIVIVSHTLDFLEQICSRILWIDHGKILKDGAPKTICSEYRNLTLESPEIIYNYAVEGIPDYQYKLALMYRDGHRLEKNIDQYNKWIKQAALTGHPLAQLKYADTLLEEGNTEEAIIYYQLSAESNNNEAKMKIAALNSSANNEYNQLLAIYEKLTSNNNSLFEYRYSDLLLKIAWDDQYRKKAIDYLIKSSDHGNPVANYQLALIYRDGVGIERDLTKMEQYLEKSANQNYVPAMTLLSDIYFQGKLLPKNESKTFFYVSKAAELGHVISMYRLASLYKEGIGTETDVGLANYWYNRYLSSGFGQYKNWIYGYAKSGFFGSDFDYLQYLQSLVSSGYSNVLSEICNYKLLNNIILSDELEKLRKSAELNNNDAIRKIADYYFNGTILDQNYAEALRWYERAAMLGDSWCKSRVADMYREGRGTKKDLDRAVGIYKELSDQGNLGAMVNLINLYVSGDITDKDVFEFAKDRMIALANNANADANKRLGGYYYEGYGVPTDYAEALRWYERAAMLGDSWCKQKVLQLKEKINTT